MSKNPLSAALAKALEAVSRSPLEEVAEKLGLSSSALRRWRLQDRVPSADLALRVARVLRARARRLEALAGRLEELAKFQPNT